MSYFRNISKGIRTTAKGLRLTWKHILNARFTRGAINVQDDSYFLQEVGHVTLQFPHQTIEVPDNGRYQLDCEMDDCIVCDKCAKICPVDCIEIEAIKSPEIIRQTSDGSPVRLHAATFNIDMAKCCFCGLCTTVCPTECLTMNSEYDYSTFDIFDLNFAFATLSPEEAEEKRKLYDQFVAEKEAAKKQPTETVTEPKVAETAQKRPAFMPKMKPSEPVSETKPEEKPQAVSKPAFVPKMKPKTEEVVSEIKTEEVEKPKAAFVPKMKPKTEEVISEIKAEETEKPKAAFRPTMKPKTEEVVTEIKAEETEKPKAAFRPTMKPKTEEVVSEIKTEETEMPKAEEKVEIKEELLAIDETQNKLNDSNIEIQVEQAAEMKSNEVETEQKDTFKELITKENTERQEKGYLKLTKFDDMVNARKKFIPKGKTNDDGTTD